MGWGLRSSIPPIRADGQKIAVQEPCGQGSGTNLCGRGEPHAEERAVEQNCSDGRSFIHTGASRVLHLFAYSSVYRAALKAPARHGNK